MKDLFISHEYQKNINDLIITHFRVIESNIVCVYGYNNKSAILGKETLTDLLNETHNEYLKGFYNNGAYNSLNLYSGDNEHIKPLEINTIVEHL